MIKPVSVLLLLACACGKPKHIAECDAFEATMDKIVHCKTLPKTVDLNSIIAAQKQMKGVFEMIDQSGGIEKAPKDMQDSIKETCRTQNKQVVEVYQTVAPDCLK
jgi:hypothetical protein